MSTKTTWRELIEDALVGNGECWEDIVFITLSERDLSRRFENEYGGPSGPPFGAWTASYVYFPLSYDGLASCGSAPRNPRSEPLPHQGG